MRCTYSYAHVCRRKVLLLILHMKKQQHKFSVLIRILQFREKKEYRKLYSRRGKRAKAEERTNTRFAAARTRQTLAFITTCFTTMTNITLSRNTTIKTYALSKNTYVRFCNIKRKNGLNLR